MPFFLIALNLDLTLPDYRSRRELSGSILKSQNGALGVELRPFYWKKKNFCPNVIYYVFVHSLLTYFPLTECNVPVCSRAFRSAKTTRNSREHTGMLHSVGWKYVNRVCMR